MNRDQWPLFVEESRKISRKVHSDLALSHLAGHTTSPFPTVRAYFHASSTKSL